jgi:hypothetical protein
MELEKTVLSLAYGLYFLLDFLPKTEVAISGVLTFIPRGELRSLV